MESPLMQSMLANPDALQNMLTSNPQIQQLMEVWASCHPTLPKIGRAHV